ncbi:MAG: tetratricopeptide repeat protein [Myxococcales bacterium]|nr:tetratricopeptide repeat protein [Myxococcales bacterium]
MLGAGCAARKEVVDRDRALVETLAADGAKLETLNGDLADGAQALRDGELDEAKAALDRHLAKHPGSALGAYHLGLWALESAKPSVAQGYFQRASDLDGQFHAALCHLGVLYLRQGEDVAALRVLEQALLIAPDDVRVLANVGAARARRGLWSEALQAYQAANKIAPAHGSLLYDTALVWMARSQWQPALDLLEQAISVRPFFAPAHAAKVVCLQGVGQIDEAEVAAKQAIEELPQPNHELLIAYARLLVHKRQIADAMKQLRRAIEVAPEDAGAQLALGELSDAAGDRAAATEMYQKFLKNPLRLAADSRRIRDRLKQLQSGKQE